MILFSPFDCWYLLLSPVWMEFREFLRGHGQCNSLKLPRTMRGCRPSKWHPLFLLNCQMQTIWVSQKFKKDKSPFKRTSGFSQTLNNERPQSTAAQWESTTVARRVPWVFYLLWAVRLQVLLFSYGIVPRMRYSPQERETDLLAAWWKPPFSIFSVSVQVCLSQVSVALPSRGWSISPTEYKTPEIEGVIRTCFDTNSLLSSPPENCVVT